MRPIIHAAAFTLIPAFASAHPSVMDHAHPHGEAHSYLGTDALLAFAVGAVFAAALAVHAILQRRSK